MTSPFRTQPPLPTQPEPPPPILDEESREAHSMCEVGIFLGIVGSVLSSVAAMVVASDHTSRSAAVGLLSSFLLTAFALYLWRRGREVIRGYRDQIRRERAAGGK